MRIDGNVYYVLKDRLGSAYATTDASGNVVGEMRYYAFGETRLSTGNMFTDRLYTGQRQIAELGIYHYNARFYSPKLGRFLSADSIMSGMANPQNLNRFSYVANNPLRYTDPTGHMMWEGDDGGYTPAPSPAPDDYCATHPWVCGGGGGGGDSDDDGGDGGGGSGNNEGGSSSGSACSSSYPSILCNPTTPAQQPPFCVTHPYYPECYIPQNNSNMPDPLFDQLIDAGVSEDFLDSVTIVVYDEAPWWDTGCWSGNPAITSGNTITFCSSQYYDTAQVSPALVHELVHVNQYQEDPFSHLKIPLSNVFNADNNPYENEAYDCSDPLWELYYNGEDLPALNVAPCNLP